MNVGKIGVTNAVIPQTIGFKGEEPQLAEQPKKESHTGRNILITALLAAAGVGIYIATKGKGKGATEPVEGIVKQNEPKYTLKKINELRSNIKAQNSELHAETEKNVSKAIAEIKKEQNIDFAKSVDAESKEVKKNISPYYHAKRKKEIVGAEDRRFGSKPAGYSKDKVTGRTDYGKVVLNNGTVVENKEVIKNGDKTIIKPKFYEYQLPNNGG